MDVGEQICRLRLWMMLRQCLVLMNTVQSLKLITPKVKVGKNTLKANRDFTVKYLRNGVKGEAEMIITGTGNYTGECRKTFIVQ